MNSTQPEISVITINYNGYHDTCEFIDSWMGTVTSVSYEIIVVDNGSTANEGLLLQQKYPSVRVIRSEKNLGFAGGNNLGMRSAKGDYFFFLNNDTLIVKDTVDLLIKRLLSSEKIIGVSPLILNYTEPHAIQFAGYTRLSFLTLRNRAIGRGSRDKSRYPAKETPYLHGAAMLLKKKVIPRIGLMSEEYFLYYEELDWCTSMTIEGHKLWYDPAFEIWHKDSSSTGKGSPMQCYYLSRNRLLYAYRNLPDRIRWFSLIYQLAIVYPKDIIMAWSKGQKEIVKAHREGVKAFLKTINRDK